MDGLAMKPLGVGPTLAVAAAMMIASAATDARTPVDDPGDPGDSAANISIRASRQMDDSTAARTIAMMLASSRTPKEIGRALERRGVSRLNIHRVPRGGAKRSTELDPNTFSVRSTWADWYSRGKKYVAFYGNWNFKNSFIGSGAPYDGAAMALSGFGSKCWTNVDTGVIVQDQTGTHHPLGWLKSSSQQRSVFGIHDRTRAFNLLNDMGMGWIEMRQDRTGKSCGGRKSGTFYYEHNQGGSGSWSGSVSVRVFSISYNGSGGLRLQKATKISYYN